MTDPVQPISDDNRRHIMARAKADTDVYVHVRRDLVFALDARLIAAEAALAAALAREATTRAMLRIECGEVDANEWSDDLHLADVIEKHLCRTLHALIDKYRPAHFATNPESRNHEGNSMNNDAVMSHLTKLGHRVRDRVTGLEGVIVSISFDLYGCIQAIVNPGLDKDGKPRESVWHDIARLELTGTEPVMAQPNFEVGPVAKGLKGPAEKPNNPRY